MSRLSTFLIVTIALTCATAPLVSFAQFVPLQGIPGLPTGDHTFKDYITALYYLSIGVAAALAVVKIIMAGMSYMLTDIVTNKASAKKDIQGALIGLLIVLGAVTILNEINPNLTNFNVLRNADVVSTTIVRESSDGSECPAGQVMMECATEDSASYECRPPGDTGWCEGRIQSGDELSPFDETNTGTWVVTVNGMNAVGDSPAIQASDLKDVCEDEGGEPSVEHISDTIVKVTCRK